MTYFIIFLLLSFFSVYFFKNIQKKKFQLAYCLCLIIFISIAGLRYEIGIDYFSYQSKFMEMPKIKTFLSQPILFIAQFKEIGWEPLSKILMIILHSITNDSQILFFVASIICSILLFKSIKYFTEKRHFFFSLLIYFSFVYLFQEMHALRQALGACVFYYALMKKSENHGITAFTISLIAVGFHYAMILFVPILLFIDKKINIRIQIIILILCAIIFIFHIRWMNIIFSLLYNLIPEAAVTGRILNYVSADAFERPFFITFVLYIIPYLFLLFCQNKFKAFTSRKDIIAQNIYFLYLVFTMIFWEFSYFSTRFGWICLWGMAICLPKLIDYFKARSKFVPASYIIFFSYIVVSTFLFPDYTTSQFTPYDNYIECKWLGVDATGKERAEKYMHEMGLEFNF